MPSPHLVGATWRGGGPRRTRMDSFITWKRTNPLSMRAMVRRSPPSFRTLEEPRQDALDFGASGLRFPVQLPQSNSSGRVRIRNLQPPDGVAASWWANRRRTFRPPPFRGIPRSCLHRAVATTKRARFPHPEMKEPRPCGGPPSLDPELFEPANFSILIIHGRPGVLRRVNAEGVFSAWPRGCRRFGRHHFEARDVKHGRGRLFV